MYSPRLRAMKPIASIVAHIGKHRSAFLAGRGSMRPDGVMPYSGGHYKRLSIVHHKRSEGAGWTFHHDFLAFDEVQHMDCALGVVKNLAGKPMPACFDELQFMQSRSLFPPTITSRDRNELIDEVRPRPFGCAVPLDIPFAMLDVNGPWALVETKPSPIPKLEREDVRCRADLQHHTAFAAAMHSACGDQEVIVFASWKLIDVLLGRKVEAALLRPIEVGDHTSGVDPCL